MRVRCLYAYIRACVGAREQASDERGVGSMRTAPARASPFQIFCQAFLARRRRATRKRPAGRLAARAGAAPGPAVGIVASGMRGADATGSALHMRRVSHTRRAYCAIGLPCVRVHARMCTSMYSVR